MTAPTKDLRKPPSAVRRRLQGVALLVVVALVVTFCLASFAKLFRFWPTVYLEAATVGNQLSEQADVKIRGVIVGEVTTVETTGTVATLTMQIDPSAITSIPRDTRALLIPKTLFGERFVSLTVPGTQDVANPLQDGDTIPEASTANTTETETVLNNLLPVLQAVQPQKLSATLGAISMALEGRGAQVGDTLVLLDRYLQGLNPALPDLIANLQRIPQVADIYNAALPDLLGALDNLVTTSQTLVEQRAALESTLRTVTSASNVTAEFLAANRNNIIQSVAVARPVLELLARYSPEFPCLFQQLTDLIPKIDNVIDPNTGLQILAEITINRGKYVPQEAPQYADRRGPRCYNIVGGDSPQYPPGGPIRDGTIPKDGNANPPSLADSFPSFGSLVSGNPLFGGASAGATPGATAPVLPQSALPGGGESLPVVPRAGSEAVDPLNISVTGTPNSPEDRELVTELTALQMGSLPGEVPAFAPYLTASTMRGLPVSLR